MIWQGNRSGRNNGRGAVVAPKRRSSRLASPPAPGTNTAGTARSSGAGVGSGVTTGSGTSAGSGTDMTGPQRSGDAEIAKENKEVDRKIKSICRGC